MELDTPILITGGTGFVGSHLLELLLERGYSQVHVTAYDTPDTFFTSRLAQNQIHQLNLTDVAATEQLIKTVQPKVVIHLAAFAAVGSSFDNVVSVLQNNTLLQYSLLHSLEQFAPQARILIVSSAEVYGKSLPGEVPISEDHPLRPVNPYAVSKVNQDLLAGAYSISHGLDIVRVRPFNHIGERQSPQFVVAAFAKQLVAVERGELEQMTVGNLDAVRDFTDVKDMVAAYLLLLESGISGEVYNCGTGNGTRISEILDQLKALSSKKISVVQDSSLQRPHDVPEMIADPSKIFKLGWKPEIPVSDTLARILAYWRSQ